MKKLNIDWVIHLVANGACCEQCGEIETSFKKLSLKLRELLNQSQMKL